MSAHIPVPLLTVDNRTDAELARRAEAGDPTATEELAASLQRRVPCWVHHWYRNDAYERIVADRVHDRIRAKLPQYNPARGAFSTWAYKLAYRATLNEIRDLHLDRKEVSFESLGDDTLLSEADPADDYKACRVREEVDRLSLELGTIIRMRFYDGLSVERIARKLHLTRKQVRLRLEKAMWLLRRRLACVSSTSQGPISGGQVYQ